MENEDGDDFWAHVFINCRCCSQCIIPQVLGDTSIPSWAPGGVQPLARPDSRPTGAATTLAVDGGDDDDSADGDDDHERIGGGRDLLAPAPHEMRPQRRPDSRPAGAASALAIRDGTDDESADGYDDHERGGVSRAPMAHTTHAIRPQRRRDSRPAGAGTTVAASDDSADGEEEVSDGGRALAPAFGGARPQAGHRRLAASRLSNASSGAEVPPAVMQLAAEFAGDEGLARPRSATPSSTHRPLGAPAPPEVMQLAAEYAGAEGGQRPATAAPSSVQRASVGAPAPLEVIERAAMYSGHEGAVRPLTAVPSRRPDPVVAGGEDTYSVHEMQVRPQLLVVPALSRCPSIWSIIH